MRNPLREALRHVKVASMGNVSFYIFECPLCGKSILGKTANEVGWNGARHLEKCAGRREKLGEEV